MQTIQILKRDTTLPKKNENQGTELQLRVWKRKQECSSEGQGREITLPLKVVQLFQLMLSDKNLKLKRQKGGVTSCDQYTFYSFQCDT